MKTINILFFSLLIVVSASFSLPAKADTVKARCDVYPKGEDHTKNVGICTFSQRQGFVSIQLANGKRYELKPVGDQAGNYLDQNGKAAYRQSGLGDRGQIYRLATESIYVYWDTNISGNNTSPKVTATNRGLSTLKAQKASNQIKVHRQPTIKSEAPQYGIDGDKVTVINCVQDKDTKSSDLNWCKVKFSKSGAIGWIRSDFIIFADGGE